MILNLNFRKPTIIGTIYAFGIFFIIKWSLFIVELSKSPNSQQFYSKSIQIWCKNTSSITVTYKMTIEQSW